MKKLLTVFIAVPVLVAGLVLSSGLGVQAQSRPGLVAAYGFSEGSGTLVTDSSGSNNTGTISGAIWTAQGKFGSALSFDGVNDWVTVNDAPSLDLTTAMTLEAWVFPIAAGGGWRTVILKEQPGHLVYAMYANTNTDRPSGEIATTITSSDTRGPAFLPLNTWTHLAVTYDGAILGLWVNGVVVSSRAVSGDLAISTGALRIGGNSVWGEHFQGVIDEVRIYNRALTQDEIQSDMNAPIGGPQLLIIQPAQGATIVGTTTVSVTYSAVGDLAEVNHVHFRLDENPEVMDLTFDGSYQFFDVPFGAHSLSGYLARADHSKIAGSDASVTFTTADGADSVPPSVVLTVPAAGATVSGTITVAAEASDDVGVAEVEFFVDGSTLGAPDTVAPYAIPWNTGTVENGGHTVTAIARDTSRNQSAHSVSVLVSNPTLSDPAQVGQWSGPFDWPIVAIHAALLPSGEVLAWDSVPNGGVSAHLWNPATGTFSPVPNNSSDLFCAGHATLPDGRLLVAGGHVSPFIGIPDGNLFDPVTKSWTSTPPMAFSRWYPTATTLPDGRVLVIAGTQTCATCPAEIPELYNPNTNTWTQLANAGRALPTYPFMFALADGRVLVAGSNVASTPADILDISTETWTTLDPAVTDGGSAAMYLPGKLLKSGTASPEFSALPASADTYVLDMTQPAPRWRRTPSMAFPRAHHTLTILPDGTVLATGGARTTEEANASQAIFAAELWAPLTETWTTMASMQVSRLYHSTALLLPDGRVLAAGGRAGGIIHFNAEIYWPPYLFKGPRPVITAASSTLQYGTSFFVETPDASNIDAVSLIRLSAVTHGFNQDQRFVNLTFQPTTGGLHVQAPISASSAPAGYYMLFILGTDGVPSIASFVRLTEDPQPPAVSLTAPTPGSTVSDITTVIATASDDVGVVGVQFKLDGFNLGAVDTAPPYSISWNTATATNGTHTLSAVARDAAGNTANSEPVTVTVANTSTPPTGLVAAYSFNEGSGTMVVDASGNNNHGSLAGPTWTLGRFGNALSFDGVNDWVTVSDAPSLDLTTGMTLEAWVYPAALSGWRTVLLRERSGHLAYAMYANTDSNQPSGEIATTITSGDTRGPASLPLNTWAYLAVTYDGAILGLWVDGALVSSRAVGGDLLISGGALRIGGNSVWGEHFEGLIDEVRIYNRALSASEIQADMNIPIRP